jgi:hypothetical protein
MSEPNYPFQPLLNECEVLRETVNSLFLTEEQDMGTDPIDNDWDKALDWFLEQMSWLETKMTEKVNALEARKRASAA